MDFFERCTDAELLSRTGREPQAFATFYRRHERLVFRYLMSRSRDPELAADLAAEVFARALEAADRFKPESSAGTGGVPWLLAIARNTLLASAHHGP